MNAYHSKEVSSFQVEYFDKNGDRHRLDGPAIWYNGRGGYKKNTGWWFLHGRIVDSYVDDWCDEFGIDRYNMDTQDTFLVRMKMEALEEILFGELTE